MAAANVTPVNALKRGEKSHMTWSLLHIFPGSLMSSASHIAVAAYRGHSCARCFGTNSKLYAPWPMGLG